MWPYESNFRVINQKVGGFVGMVSFQPVSELFPQMLLFSLSGNFLLILLANKRESIVLLQRLLLSFWLRFVRIFYNYRKFSRRKNFTAKFAMLSYN